MYGRPGLVRRRPLLRAAALSGTFAAGRAMSRPATGEASAESRQDQRVGDLGGQQSQHLLRSGGDGPQSQPLLRAGGGHEHQPLLRPTGEGQQNQPLLRPTREGVQSQPLLRAAGEGQHQPLMQAGPPPSDTGLASAAGQLSKLAELHLQGELTDDEFAAAKAMTLGRG